MLKRLSFLSVISLWSKGLPGDQGLSGSALQLFVSVSSERGPGVGRPHGCALTAQVWTREGQRPHGRSALMISATFIQTWCRRRTTLWLVFGFFPDSSPCSWLPSDLHCEAACAVVQSLGRFMASYFSNQALHILPPHHVAVLPPLHLPHGKNT